MDQDQAQQQTRQHDKNLARNNSRVFLDYSETNQHVKVLSEPSSQNGGEIKEDIRCWMVGLVEGLGRDAFKGAWRDNWLKSRKQEMIRKIESGSLKEMCSALVKMELEMNWNSFSAHFGEQRERILSVLRKGDDAPDVLRELLVLIGAINPKYLMDGCIQHEELKTKDLNIVTMNEKRECEKQLIHILESEDTSVSANLKDYHEQLKVQDSSSKASRAQNSNCCQDMQDRLKRRNCQISDSTLVWALYRKNEWWPAQVNITIFALQCTF